MTDGDRNEAQFQRVTERQLLVISAPATQRGRRSLREAETLLLKERRKHAALEKDFKAKVEAEVAARLRGAQKIRDQDAYGR
eukprot:1920108-Pleurochrysis_carterae.AAC.1